jgi:3-deoxy-D-manno-octulosonic-acid transferase
MFSAFYNLALVILFLSALPKIMWQWLKLGKYRESFGQRLGWSTPSFVAQPDQQVIWMHAVSVGEVRALIPLYQKIKEAFPHAALLISTTTETGQAESKRSLPDADCHFFLPLDFSWVIRRLLKQLKPDLLILVESDFWYHLLSLAKKNNTQVFLVNGKVSERSTHRFQFFSSFTRRLFSSFDLLCVQSERFKERFISLGVPSSNIIVTGNLKFDAKPPRTPDNDLQAFKDHLHLNPLNRILVLGSTHAKEEEMILNALLPLWQSIPHLKTLLVPRHPERFDEVAKILRNSSLKWGRISQPLEFTGEEQVILIDTMGLLNRCYEIAEVAIVCGSFIAHVGGHNILEPVLLGVPVLFGPHMHSQLDLKEHVLAAQAGFETTLSTLPSILLNLMENPKTHAHLIQNCHALAASLPGSALRTLQAIQKKKIEL